MAHIAPPAPSRRRLEFGFGVLLLLIGSLVAVLAVVALDHPPAQQANASETYPVDNSARVPGSASVSATPPATGTATPSESNASPSNSAAGSGKLPLIVLNNTSDTPAGVAADRFRNAGWTVTDISTFDGDILSTAAYFDPEVAGASAAATELQREFPAIQRVKPKFQGLPEGPVVVVLTSDYS
ncbi:MAG: LytR C-terminal domain-containing protein [Jatrophihabitantaceae bacterium]